jgi:hypothetical protein
MGPPIFRTNRIAKGRKRDAALYIAKLPRAELDAEEWQAAMEALLVAERNGPTMFGGSAS